MNPRSFNREVLEAFEFCAFGKSFKALVPSNRFTVPVGQVLTRLPLLSVHNPELEPATSTLKM